jgi:hypothetical protein
VIEVATATEVALTSKLHDRLQAVPSEARDVIVKQANGLVGALTLLEKIDGISRSDSQLERVKDQLAKPRNDAVHRGLKPPDATTLQRAVTTARAVLDRYSPLPQP